MTKLSLKCRVRKPRLILLHACQHLNDEMVSFCLDASGGASSKIYNSPISALQESKVIISHLTKMALGPKAPVYYVPNDANATHGWRLTAAVFNWLNHLSHLTAVPTGQVWDCQQSTEVNPDLRISINHVVQTILATDPAYSDIFQQSGLDRLPNLHHITFSIGTRITDRTAEGRTEEERSKERLSYEILVVVKTYDSANNVLLVTDNVTYFPGCYGGTDLCYYADWGWGNAPITMLPILKDVFGEW
jgi:hypothetical protein